jgi:hypothetical protein
MHIDIPPESLESLKDIFLTRSIQYHILYFCFPGDRSTSPSQAWTYATTNSMQRLAKLLGRLSRSGFISVSARSHDIVILSSIFCIQLFVGEYKPHQAGSEAESARCRGWQSSLGGSRGHFSFSVMTLFLTPLLFFALIPV